MLTFNRFSREQYFGLLLKWGRLLYVLLAFSLASCTSGFVKHGFEFDARHDSTDVEILNYRYGSSSHPGARATEYQLKSGQVPQAARVFGGMRLGDILYVKWKNVSSGAVYEDTVPLDRLLPRHVRRHTIRFIIDGSALNVYLVSPYKLDPNPCPPRDEILNYIHSKNPDERLFARFCSVSVNKIYPVVNIE